MYLDEYVLMPDVLSEWLASKAGCSILLSDLSKAEPMMSGT
jgi:hypothetical protein